MGTEIQITAGPQQESDTAVSVGGGVYMTTVVAGVKALVDVQSIHQLDLEFRVYVLNSGTTKAIAKVQTSMQNLSDADGLWTTVLTSADVTTSNKSVAFTSGSGRLLRYVRWAIELYAASGIDVGATFDITGMARSD